MTNSPWWLLTTSRLVSWALAIAAALIVALYIRSRHGRALVSVRVRGHGLELMARSLAWVAVPHAPPWDVWVICERGIELPNEYNNGFLPWAAVERVDWDGTRLLIDIDAGGIFRSALERYELDVPPDQVPEVAQAISGRILRPRSRCRSPWLRVPRAKSKAQTA